MHGEMGLINAVLKGLEMSKYVKTMSVFTLVLFMATFFVGCDSSAKTGAAVGAGGGALAGQAIGGDTSN